MLNFKDHLIESAIFDMDGTLFDTERLRFQTLSQAALELAGRPFSEEVLLGSLGLSAVKAEAQAKQVYGADFPYQAIRRRADELELEHVRTHGVPIKPGLIPVLERLRKSGLKMAVATSSRRAIAEEFLINANVYKYFDLLVCGDEVGQGKPHPEIFLKAAAALHVEPSGSLMFEDSENGLRAASASGGLAILIEDIKLPAPEALEKAFQRYPDMRAFLLDLAACTPKLPMPGITDAFPQALNQLKAGIHGFGAMGGGYLAQVFSHWDGYTRPCEIIASTGNALLRAVINALGHYSVRYGSLAFDQTIPRVRMISPTDGEAMGALYCECEIVALCLPEQAVAGEAGSIAAGLLERYRSRGESLTLLVVQNKVGGGRFVREAVEAALLGLTTRRETQRVLERVEFAETVVTRVVSRLSEESILRQLRIKHPLLSRQVADTPGDELDSEALVRRVGSDDAELLQSIVGSLREVAGSATSLADLHLVLFNSEVDMALYAQRGSELLEHLRQVDTVPDITEVQVLKNRLWNGPHAIIAWCAALLGHATIGHAMGDARVTALLDQILEQELLPSLSAEYPAQRQRIRHLLGVFRQRCAQSFKDVCERVGRDPLRKLQRRERIFGSLAMVLRQGRAAPGLALGAALAVWYALQHPAAREDRECITIRERFSLRGSLRDVLTWRSPQAGPGYTSLDPVVDAFLIEAVQPHFDGLRVEGLAYLERVGGLPA
nr:HAD-IA family hydrolase [uncultured Holophaga sp.]